VETTVSLLDIMPTVLARAAVPADGLAGRDLASLAAPEAAAPRVTSVRVNRHLESQRSERARGNLNVAVDDGRWRAIWNVDDDRLELYDTHTDATEQRDCAADHPERAAALGAVARDWTAGRWPDDVGHQTADVSGLREETVDRLRQLGYLR
jgi:arylsulfatase A-like enzyme